MKIYTGQGDRGSTRLLGGPSIRKDNARIEICGTLDELNSILGLIRSVVRPQRIKKPIYQIQNDLFLISSELAAPVTTVKKKFRQRFGRNYIRMLEHHIDTVQDFLPPLKNFILPGGTPSAAWLHLARTVCRRAERRLVTLMRKEKTDPDILVYLNRLSDFLFVLARYANYLGKQRDVVWKNMGE
jgi:cob(I)alamin adenosyltransferase